jgi:hypothetical protein
MRWDTQKCVELFRGMQLGVEARDVKFSRRVGPRGEGGRPLIVGFYSEGVKNMGRRAKRGGGGGDGPDPCEALTILYFNAQSVVGKINNLCATARE